MFKRSDKVADAIQQIVSSLLIKGLKDPRVGFVTITGVDVTDDLSYAKIHFSVIGTEEEKKRTEAGLKSATGFIRTEIGKELRLRHTPEITFKRDESAERGERIERILKEIHEQGN